MRHLLVAEQEALLKYTFTFIILDLRGVLISTTAYRFASLFWNVIYTFFFFLQVRWWKYRIIVLLWGRQQQWRKTVSQIDVFLDMSVLTWRNDECGEGIQTLIWVCKQQTHSYSQFRYSHWRSFQDTYFLASVLKYGHSGHGQIYKR